MNENKGLNPIEIPRDVAAKYEKLKAILQDMKKIVVAFSGGVDSSFLLKAAYDELAGGVMAVTLGSEVISPRELEEAQDIARHIGASHVVLRHSALENPDFVQNTPLRCYFCKKDEFAEIKKFAQEKGFHHVVDGSNQEDMQDYRPGAKALQELGVRSPLREAALVKQDIRLLSRALGLPTWNKPATACLASRFPYNTRIEKSSLKKVGLAEDYLRDLGFRQVRVRHHGSIARIEVVREQFNLLFEKKAMDRIVQQFKKLGYHFVTLDLQGYRLGSLNEELGGTE